MITTQLNPTEREALQSFVEASLPGTAYLRRARIVLLDDQGLPAESIATEIDVPVVRVRQLMRAFRREGMALFPSNVIYPRPDSSLEEPIAETGRNIMATLLDLALEHEPGLSQETDAFSVHETRKAIRQLRTACRLFEPYYEEGILTDYRRRFRKFMRRLARSRDITVFLLRLDDYLYDPEKLTAMTAGQREDLEILRRHWQERLATANEKIRKYLSKGKYRALLLDFEQFANTPGEGLSPAEDFLGPPLTSHLAPALIYEKLAAVRAFDHRLEDAQPAILHSLRIRTKELRYTLEFFQPMLEPSASESIDLVKQLLIHLGELNDARVHSEMLARVESGELAPGSALFREAREADLAQLTADLLAPWSAFNQPSWRKRLAEAVAVL